MELLLVALFGGGLGVATTLWLTRLPSDGEAQALRPKLSELAGRLLRLPTARSPLTDEVVRETLACARRIDGGPLRLPAEVVVAVHSDDYPVLVDTRERVERAVRHSAAARRIHMAVPTRIGEIVRDTGVRRGCPRVTGRERLAATKLAATKAVTHAQDSPVSAVEPALAAQPRLRAGSACTARFVIVDATDRQFVVPEAGCIVGRDGTACAIRIDLPTVSRLHAELVRDDDGFTVIDRDSANGIMINAKRTERGRLRDGDILGLGHSVRLRLHMDDDG